MALFDDRLAQDITALVRRRYLDLGAALGEPAAPACEPAAPAPVDSSVESSPLQRDLALLIGVANGQFDRTETMVRRVDLALTRLLDALLGNVLHGAATIPDGFWHTDAGILVSRVRWWVSVDDLITISNAAALAFGDNTQAHRMRIARAIDQGLLDWVPDPSIANPQQNRRVLRPQVERLRDQRRLPE